MIGDMGTVHITEAELARDLHDILAKVQQGVEVFVEQDHSLLRGVNTAAKFSDCQHTLHLERP